MLSRLIKYNFRSTWRDFAGIYMSILLGVIIVPLMLNNINNQIVNLVAGFIASSIVIAVVVVILTNLFRIFNVNVFSKEGYLTMTLPVTPTQIVFSKLIVSSMWIILTSIVSVIGIFIFLFIIDSINYVQISEECQKILAHLNGHSTLTFILLILAIIISSLKEVAKLFLACSIAHLKQLNRNRVPVGIASYFVFSWIESLIVQIFVMVLALVSTRVDELISKLEAMSNLAGIEQFIRLFNVFIGIGTIYALLLTAVYSIGTIWILNHKLDLD